MLTSTLMQSSSSFWTPGGASSSRTSRRWPRTGTFLVMISHSTTPKLHQHQSTYAIHGSAAHVLHGPLCSQVVPHG